MNIGAVSEKSGLPTKTIRYYEEVGLIQPKRGPNGYRRFDDRDLHRLAFLHRSRGLGFSIEECRTLLALYEDKDRESARVKELAAEHLERIDERIAELQSLRNTLAELVSSCHGNTRPDCPILDDLSQSGQ